jgi:integration host factor subunit alpha
MLKKNLTRKEISNKIYKKLGFSKNISSEMVDSFFEILTSDIIKSEKVKISSFGTFKVIKKSERVGRNPKTKVEAIISKRRVVKFQSSQIVKKKINNNE